MKKTYNTIKVGDKFFDPTYCEKSIEAFEVVRVEVNPNGGKSVKDMWGGSVWSEPKFFVVAKSLKSGKEVKFPLQGEESDLSSWKTFFETDAEMRKHIYEYRKREYCNGLRKRLLTMDYDFMGFPLYEDCIDENLKEIFEIENKLLQKLLVA